MSLVGDPPPKPQVAVCARRWDYTAVRLPNRKLWRQDAWEVMWTIKEWGNEGWELVATVDDDTLLIFKRYEDPPGIYIGARP